MNADWKSGAGRQLQAANQQITLCQGMIANDPQKQLSLQNAPGAVAKVWEEIDAHSKTHAVFAEKGLPFTRKALSLFASQLSVEAQEHGDPGTNSRTRRRDSVVYSALLLLEYTGGRTGGIVSFAAAEDSASQNAIIRKASGFGVSDFTQRCPSSYHIRTSLVYNPPRKQKMRREIMKIKTALCLLLVAAILPTVPAFAGAIDSVIV